MLSREEELNETEPLKSSSFNQSYVANSKLLNSDMENPNSPKFKMPKKEYLFIFFILVYSMAFFGTGSSLFGLSILEFAKNLHVNVAQISYGLTISFIFGIFGSLTATYTLDKLNRQLQLAFVFTVLAIIFIVLPWIRLYALYLVLQGLSGFMVAFIGVIPNVWIMEMFGDLSKTFLQVMHTFFPIGQLFGPIIYISIVGDHSANLWIPYMMVGLCKLSANLMILIAFFIKPYRSPKNKNMNKKDEEQNQSIEVKNNISQKYKIVFVCMISAVSAIQLTSEFNGITYISTYLRKSNLQLNDVDAAYCQGVLSTSAAVGRVLNIFLTLKIRPETMLFINFIFMIAGNCVIMTWGNSSIQGIYLGASLLGYGFSNAYPMMIAYVDERIVLSNKIMSCIHLVAATLMSINPSILGKFLDTYPRNYVILNLCLISLSFGLYIMLNLLEALRKTKRTQKIFNRLFAVYTLDKFNRQVQLGIAFIFFSILFTITPLLTSYNFYLVISGLSGLFSTFQVVIPNVWVLEMFDSASKIYLQILHTFFPIGQMFGPMIYIPFVRTDNSTIILKEFLTNKSSSYFDSLIVVLFETTKHSNLWAPYLIVGLFKISAGVLIMIAYCIKPYKKPKKETKDLTNNHENVDEAVQTNLTSKYKLGFVFLINVVCSIQLATEFISITYISTYLQRSDLRLDEVTAAYCQGIISTSTTVGRIVNIFLTLKIRSDTMLFINFSFMIAGNFVIMTWASYSIQGIYLGVGMLGYGFSNAYPMMIAYVNERIGISNKIMSCMNTSGGILLTISPSVFGYFLDTKPFYFIVLNLSMTVFSFIIYILIVVLEGLRGSNRI